MAGSVAPDATFLICFLSDINRRDWLFNFMDCYSFHIGPVVMNEMPKGTRSNPEFAKRIIVAQLDYYQLLKPILGKNRERYGDGEYEAIGIAYELLSAGKLSYLITDDKQARNFVKNNLPDLAAKLVGTIGFVRDSCIKDTKTSSNAAIEILECMKKAFETVTNPRKRPCSMDANICREILVPTLELLRKRVGN
jgi:predicted nucleic acid-binding protein